MVVPLRPMLPLRLFLFLRWRARHREVDILVVGDLFQLGLQLFDLLDGFGFNLFRAFTLDDSSALP
jgi:hypothetical protein